MSEIERIIRNKEIRSVFQPIISLRDGSVLGYEALSRMIFESPIKDIEELFRLAGKENRLWELEVLCRTVAFETVLKPLSLKKGQKLFVNVNPNTIHDSAYQKGLTRDMLAYY